MVALLVGERLSQKNSSGSSTAVVCLPIPFLLRASLKVARYVLRSRSKGCTIEGLREARRAAT